MADGDWRDRLGEALRLSGMSMRKASTSAGLSAGYLYGVLVSDKEPTISNLVAICDVLEVSVTWVVYGVEMSPDAERLLRLFGQLSPAQQKNLLDLAESARKLLSP